MPDFRHALSTQPRWEDAVRECVAALGDTRDDTLGFVYAADSFGEDFASILSGLREATGIEHWVGTLGVGVIATGQEVLDAPALAVMTANLPRDDWRVLDSVTQPHAAAARVDPARDFFAVLHGDPRNREVARMLAEVAERLGSGFAVGGLTSSRGAWHQIADHPTEGGLSGVLFSERVNVATSLTQSVSPIGPRRRVTECQDNIVVSIDHRPALDVMKEDIGELLARDLRRAAGLIFVGLPVEGSDTGDYLVRNLMGIDPDRGLIAVGEHLDAGDAILFCKRDTTSAVADMQRMLDDLKARTGGTPRAGLYYSCLGRGASMFGPGSVELSMIRATLGEFPLVGFFANGEISRDRLYGYTGVLTLFT
jgi:small ligand-binding sensory domain FIST